MNISLVHHINASLKARNLFNKDQHYVVRDNSIIIVDEFTGRMMPGRRWSEGIHQAVEAKKVLKFKKKIKRLLLLHSKIILGCIKNYLG